MNRRTTARIVGGLFVTATVAGVLSAVLLAGDRSRAGALLVVVMAAAIAMIPAAIFPVLRERGEGVAVGYVVARTLEVVLLLLSALGPLVAASGGDASWSGTYGTWGYPVSSLFFCLAVVLLNGALWRGGLVPRLISGWALVAVVPYAVDALLVLFGVIEVSAPAHAVLIAPLSVSEMVLALWLLIKGFNR
ncbi:hypothetical protein GCM10022252_30080 [Streptosporangium oxazolinicum]|uniref:DUF4386 domain-containing protein n=1 Tax=Streptosporangium oxazolinicum TaxID=909287 RepID=A0ABP8AVB4_9ACTN